MPPVINKDGLHSFWRLAASNKENDFSNVNTSSLALLRRFSHVEVEPKVEEVLAYFMSKQLDSRVVAFLKNFPEELFPQKWDEKLTENKANPFPSTWENAAKLIEKVSITVKDKDDSNVMFSLTASCVGAAVASKFVTYAKLISKLDMDSILDTPKESLAELMKSQDKASLLYAVIYNFGSKWYKKDKKLTAAKCIEMLEILPSEFAVSFITVLIKTRENELIGQPAMDKLLTKLGKFFNF